MRKKLVLSVMGILLILGTVTNVMFTRAEKSSDRTWLASIEALEALAEDEIGAVRVDVELRLGLFWKSKSVMGVRYYLVIL